MRFAISLVLSFALVGAAGGQEPPRFNRDIRPLLSDHCFVCHGPGKQEADLRLDSFERATEIAIEPGHADRSELILRVTSDDEDFRMPPPDSKRERLTADQIAVVRKWIDAGAKYERHWSYLPVERTAPPATRDTSWVRNPIDPFVLRKLDDRGVAPSPEASRETLIRRLSFDIIGLPPTTAEIDAFLADDQPGAEERVVDRLLASPRYAERMATWWFDLIRFSDTVGYHGDQEQNIEPFRDYVIKAFNENMPFDQFTREQLAGDLLDHPDMWQIVATGYNRILQTTHEGGAQDAEYLAKMLADRVRNVSEVWLGASMGCAQCHDHKFDPYTQRDFYSMGAFFADVDHYGSFEPVARNSTPTQRPPEIWAWNLPLYEQAMDLDRQMADVQKQLDAQPEDPAPLRAELTRLRARRQSLYDREYLSTMVTEAVPPREIRILPRGNWQSTDGAVVEPALPRSLAGDVASDHRLTRLDLANWLVSPENPLTARVVVNRLWKRFYGVGISKDLIDLGAQGEWPSHPELLDWLAAELVDSGWDLKHVIRLMVTSSTYRQSAAPRQDLAEIDPENRLLARQARFRLEAEEIRDNALQVSGLLVHQLGGGFSWPYQPVGFYSALNQPMRKYRASTGPMQYRRGVYMHWQRQFLHPALTAFDAPSREECTANRPISNTPLAALVLLNDPVFVEASRGVAARILTAGPLADRDRVAWIWREVLGRRANDAEVDVLLRLLAHSRQTYTEDLAAARAYTSVGDSPRPEGIDVGELAAWTTIGRALLNLNETITRN